MMMMLKIKKCWKNKVELFLCLRATLSRVIA
jgi:hypothetical protein